MSHVHRHGLLRSAARRFRHSLYRLQGPAVSSAYLGMEAVGEGPRWGGEGTVAKKEPRARKGAFCLSLSRSLFISLFSPLSTTALARLDRPRITLLLPLGYHPRRNPRRHCSGNRVI